MLAAGAGVAPMVSLLEEQTFAPGQAVLVTRDHDSAERMRSEAICHLVSRNGLIHHALDGPRATHGTSWLPASLAGWPGPEFLLRIAPSAEGIGVGQCDVYVCGPDPWMAEVLRALREAGFSPDRIHSESFSSVPGRGTHC